MSPRPLRFLARQLGDLLLGVLVTVALFLCVEAVLRLAGFGAGHVPAPRHLAAGFDRNARVFEPDPDVPGGWRGRYSHERALELVVPPKGAARRVLLFGGSNTAELPEEVLEEALDARGPGDFEVLNLGRAGYGSTRVAILFREALERLEPDVVVLYSGHNEFVEKSFAMDLQEAWSNPLEAALARALESTVTGRLLTGVLREDGDGGGRYARLADWEAEYKKFAQASWEETLTVWDAYEANLRYMASLAGERDVPLLLCTVVWNRFSPPRVDTPPAATAPADVQEARRLQGRAREEYPEPLRALLPARDRDRVHTFDWGRPLEALPEEEWPEPLPGQRPSTGWLAGRDPAHPAQKSGEPRVRVLFESLAWLGSDPAPAERAALERAATLLARARELLPESARVRYEQALVRYALGERGAAIRSAFEEAARVDRAPRKANPLSNGRVRAVAAELEGVQLFDADARFAEACPDGLVGWEWMVDHCHLSPGAGAALLEDMAGAVAGLVEGGG